MLPRIKILQIQVLPSSEIQYQNQDRISNFIIPYSNQLFCFYLQLILAGAHRKTTVAIDCQKIPAVNLRAEKDTSRRLSTSLSRPTSSKIKISTQCQKLPKATDIMFPGNIVVVVVVVVVLTLTRIIKSVVTGQAPVTLELRNTPWKNTNNPRWYTRISRLTQFMPAPETYKSEIGGQSTMCQIHAGAYVSLLAHGKTDYTACHPRKTTTRIGVYFHFLLYYT